jgi:glycosyltransferase involved in cell wall biosynthesis
MRVRILEAFARAMPMVTTTVGLEGIDAANNSQILVRDTPSEFAAAVIELLQNPARQDELAAEGRRLAEERYDWRVVLNKMASIYEGPGTNDA